MANSLYVNKVEFGNQTVIDLTGDTVTAADVRQGVSFHLPSGASGIGTAVNGYTIYMTTTSPEFYGQTITISLSGTVIGTTAFDNTGNAEYAVEDPGTYTISVTVSGSTYTETVVVSEIDVDIEAGFQFKRWLGYTSLDPDDYASLAEVLADEKAVRQLMTVHASVDYLASFTSDDTSVAAILNNDIAAKWITCTAYAEDVLTDAYSALMESIGKYGYGKWVLQGQVPKLSADSASVIASSTYSYSGVAKWKVFDGISTGATDSDIWEPATTNLGEWIGYDFGTPVAVQRVDFVVSAGANLSITWAIEGSDDGSTWSNPYASNEIEYVERTLVSSSKSFDNTTAHRYWRVRKTAQSASSYGYIKELQFYAYSPLGNVPIMTSNTAPYGEASASSISASGRDAFHAFDGLGGSSTWWSSAGSSASSWLQYKFATPVKVSKIEFTWRTDAYTGTVMPQISNDGTNFTNLLTSAQSIGGVADQKVTVDIPAEKQEYALILRLAFTSTTSGLSAMVRNCQFYGRQMTVSVPKMDSNTSPYGEAIYSTEYNTTLKAWKAFDRTNTDSNDCWHSTGADANPYIGYDFGSPVCIGMMEWVNRNYNPAYPPNAFKLQGSNTKDSGYEDVYLGVINDSTSAKRFIFSITNRTPYRFYRVYTASKMSAGNGIVNCGMLQFFGFDYSEKEWDTAYPRHYIYDNGVELETLTEYSEHSGATEKKPYELEFGIGGQTYSIAEFYTGSIDFTDYSLFRAVAGDKITELLIQRIVTVTPYTANMYDGSQNVVATKTTSASDASLPYNISLDITSVNGSYYAMVCVGVSTGTVTRLGTITELWLE